MSIKYGSQVSRLFLNPIYGNKIYVELSNSNRNINHQNPTQHNESSIFELSKETKITFSDKEVSMEELLRLFLNNKAYMPIYCEVEYEEDKFDFVIIAASFIHDYMKK